MLFYIKGGKINLSKELVQNFEKNSGYRMCATWIEDAIETLPEEKRNEQKEIEIAILKYGEYLKNTDKNFSESINKNDTEKKTLHMIDFVDGKPVYGEI